MPSLNAQVADAVAAVITAAAISGVTVRRRWVSQIDLEDLSGTLVTVVPGQETREKHSRRATVRRITTTIGVQRRLAGGDPTSSTAQTEIDATMSTLETIADLFTPSTMTTIGATGAHWQNTDVELMPVREHLIQHNAFTAVLSLTFDKYA